MNEFFAALFALPATPGFAIGRNGQRGPESFSWRGRNLQEVRPSTTWVLQGREVDEQNLTLFTLASYNAGPGNISKMRKETVKCGLDPAQWFNKVESVTAEKIGIETTT